MRKNINEKSEPVFAPRGGKPGYIINGKWYPVDKADLNTPQLKREMQRYAQLRGVEQLKKDEASLKPKPKPAPATPDPKPAPATPDPKPAPATPQPQPKPEKKYQFTVGDKSYDLTKAQINKTYRDPKALGGVDPVAFGRAANQAIYQFKKPTPRRYTHPSVESNGAGAPMGGPYEAYDVVLDYLLSEGHADTLEEAHYVMMQLDSEYIQDVIQERAWWDPAGVFTKTDKEKELEKSRPGYDPNKGTTRLGNDDIGYTDRILAPSGGIPGAMVKGKPETWRALTDKAASSVMPRYKAVRGADQLAQDVKDNAAAARIAKLEAEAKAQASKLPPEYAARETGAPPPIIAPKPKPKPAPVVAKSKPVVATAQPTPTPTPAVAKRPSILSDVDDLKRMQAASLMRQQGRTLPGGKIPVGSDLKPKP